MAISLLYTRLARPHQGSIKPLAGFVVQRVPFCQPIPFTQRSGRPIAPDGRELPELIGLHLHQRKQELFARPCTQNEPGTQTFLLRYTQVCHDFNRCTVEGCPKVPRSTSQIVYDKNNAAECPTDQKDLLLILVGLIYTHEAHEY